MMRYATNIILLVLAIALVALNIALRADSSSRGVEFMPEMIDSVPFDSYVANPFFADGKTLREPVPGVVIHGQLPLHYTASKEDAERAGVELVNPFAPTDAKALVRGAIVFANYCQVCHGPAGAGDGPVSLRGFPTPPSFHLPNARTIPDGRIFHIITYGQVNMPSYATQIGRDDRWCAILHVRSLQKAALEKAALPKAAPATAALPKAGPEGTP